MQSATASLGSYLRQERERRRVALHDISAATKIQMRFLEADQHDQLPPLPFAVGFIRAYAQHLGLEPDAIVAEYRAMHRVPEEPEPRVMQLQPPVRPPQRWRAAVIGMLVIAIGLLTGRLWGVRVSLNGQEIALPPSRSNVVRDFLLTRQLLN